MFVLCVRHALFVLLRVCGCSLGVRCVGLCVCVFEVVWLDSVRVVCSVCVVCVC